MITEIRLSYKGLYAENEHKEFKMQTNLSYRTASAIIASTTTSAMAEPKFCTVKNTIRCHVESLMVELKPKINHGTRERTVAITK